MGKKMLNVDRPHPCNTPFSFVAILKIKIGFIKRKQILSVWFHRYVSLQYIKIKSLKFE